MAKRYVMLVTQMMIMMVPLMRMIRKTLIHSYVQIMMVIHVKIVQVVAMI